MKGTGEIINVHGSGRIIRATGKKDRHSKVYTSKGPRDRRVRLSAPTAIQFYDVQDRLGYDRPSKAVDWLIDKAKHAIDNLSNSHTQPSHQVEVEVGVGVEVEVEVEEKNVELDGSSRVAGDNNFTSSLMMPPTLSRSHSSPSTQTEVRDQSMMKSFFPMSSMNSTLLNNLSSSSSSTGRIIHQTDQKDLGLSLQTFQDHVTFNRDNNYNYTNSGGVILNSSSSHSIVSTPNQGFYYNPYYMNNSGFFSHHQQREYNYSHSSSWNESRQFPSTNDENDHHIQNTQSTSSSLFSVHFGSNFQVPARIHGEDIAEPTNKEF